MKLKMYNNFFMKVIKKQPEFNTSLKYTILEFDFTNDAICIDVYSPTMQDECRILDQMFQRIAKEKRDRGYPGLFSYHKSYKRG